ncbi:MULTISPECIES: AbiJ-related protein [Rhodococcus]|uniref:AbiJ-NTD3 domain-containing protein n=1 Tax=Rhodococcus qingshengii JCM 15477 TaxID=1303681 RepID=A0AB38RMR5_RHOSG|nr:MULTISPECIES: hypothetical protein [Rhodococcus]MEA1798839.1 hypothetical protein [Rhodococcus qingshengii]UPU46608.1 hypothetical protein M0639_33365 [Rhodococcus qingshengii JCM 15477]
MIASLRDLHNGDKLAAGCEHLGLPTPPGEGTKAERIGASFTALPDSDLPQVAVAVLRELRMAAATRNAVQDALWALADSPQIERRTRRDIARSLDIEDVAIGGERLVSMLDALWILDDRLFGDLFNDRGNLRDRVHRHVIHNPGDWSTEELFEQLGAFEASDRRFAMFLERLMSADVVLDEAVQRRLVDTVNPHLHAVGLALIETGADGGYPVFEVVATSVARNRRPKNLVFASPVRPDIRFVDAVDNDIEIVDHEDADTRALVYDRSIGPDGICWRDLQAWWKETEGLDDDELAKSTLYKRLRSSLPKTSPPQAFLFDQYHHIFKDFVQDLPALLPEVWLHWDPKTIRHRGVNALPRLRMDFLLLMPGSTRIVLEVDGQHHYATDGKPDPRQYAKNVCADRELKLRGYEVFRFGATELRNDAQSRKLVQDFFEALFRRYDVPGLT